MALLIYGMGTRTCHEQLHQGHSNVGGFTSFRGKIVVTIVDLAMAIFVGAVGGGCGGAGRGLAVGGVFESILYAIAAAVELGIVFGIAGYFLGICRSDVGRVWAGANVWCGESWGLCAGGEVGELDVWRGVGGDLFL